MKKSYKSIAEALQDIRKDEPPKEREYQLFVASLIGILTPVENKYLTKLAAYGDSDSIKELIFRFGNQAAAMIDNQVDCRVSFYTEVIGLIGSLLISYASSEDGKQVLAWTSDSPVHKACEFMCQVGFMRKTKSGTYEFIPVDDRPASGKP